MTTFIHVADIHLGACPEIGRTRNENQRKNEIWNSFEAIVKRCEEKKVDLLLIAGDLFHRQPLRRELKEVDAMFATLTHTKVVFTVGNHDYIRQDSFYRTFKWSEQVYGILTPTLSKIMFVDLNTEVYGFSYESQERTDQPFMIPIGEKKDGENRILLLHGGDAKHVPFSKEEVLSLGYDYVALGHIHKPQSLVEGMLEYPGALEPIDKNDVGPHGYIYGEIDERGCKTEFVPFSTRQYIHLDIHVKKDMTSVQIKEMIREEINHHGTEHIYKITLHGKRNEELLLDVEGFDVYGNIIEFIDHTTLAYNLETLKENNKENVLGMLIESYENKDKNSLEYEAMCRGVRALMETRR